jgi:hypothetical protein
MSCADPCLVTHTQASYRKLGIYIREDALTRALDRGILRAPVRGRQLRTPAVPEA